MPTLVGSETPARLRCQPDEFRKRLHFKPLPFTRIYTLKFSCRTVSKSTNEYVAMIADVSIERDTPHVHKVWATVDCGIAINPSIIETQTTGGLGFGLSAAMFEEITLLEGGEVDQWNYDAYRIMRNAEMPEVEIAIIESQIEPTGIGEPGTPPIAPAVGDALRTLTGETPRRLPFVAA
ncbi:molybdopterin cofactor-binding domain-containing protein [uncultured Roseobacter sp.]|uniref:molybdopterin cofactor-binding domain-containing protein n=1 Tax=uncultured Roseobacter sp. TaxID=114847 RepID=UPI0026259F10|nr:molybdopterin cofactor-binding domain-containing protein [uncultured Roseobacter sp.]